MTSNEKPYLGIEQVLIEFPEQHDNAHVNLTNTHFIGSGHEMPIQHTEDFSKLRLDLAGWFCYSPDAHKEVEVLKARIAELEAQALPLVPPVGEGRIWSGRTWLPIAPCNLSSVVVDQARRIAELEAKEPKPCE